MNHDNTPTLDLHGYRREEAISALIFFLEKQSGSGDRERKFHHRDRSSQVDERKPSPSPLSSSATPTITTTIASSPYYVRVITGTGAHSGSTGGPILSMLVQRFLQRRQYTFYTTRSRGGCFIIDVLSGSLLQNDPLSNHHHQQSTTKLVLLQRENDDSHHTCPAPLGNMDILSNSASSTLWQSPPLPSPSKVNNNKLYKNVIKKKNNNNKSNQWNVQTVDCDDNHEYHLAIQLSHMEAQHTSLLQQQDERLLQRAIVTSQQPHQRRLTQPSQCTSGTRTTDILSPIKDHYGDSKEAICIDEQTLLEHVMTISLTSSKQQEKDQKQHVTIDNKIWQQVLLDSETTASQQRLRLLQQQHEEEELLQRTIRASNLSST
jgi:hypothetical protein